MTSLLAVNWEAIFTPANMPLIAVFGMITIICATGIIAGCWQKARQTERETQLKRDLAARGYSVDEIERIVRAKPDKG